jgi:hypothetical protein
MSNSPYYKPTQLVFNSGVITSKDPAKLSEGQIAQAVNVVLDNSDMPTKLEGSLVYNSATIGSSTPNRGQISFLGDDGLNYIVTACNGALYWTNGNGTMAAVKYFNDNATIILDTVNYFYNFILYDKIISGTQKKVVYVISNVYPISKNSNSTNTPNSKFSRALRLQINAGVIIGLNVFDLADGTTAGSDEVQVGDSPSVIPWPKEGLFGVKIFDRILIANYTGATNGWTCSVAQDSENWTDNGTPILSLTGGGKYPEPFTGGIVRDMSVLLFSRSKVLRIDCAPGPISAWRETFLNTDLGCVVNQSICLHADGWVYYASEQGICRTDGVVAERVDWDIEDQIKNLAQLQRNANAMVLAGTAEFNAGTPSNGDNLLSTSNGILEQLQINTQAAWALCTLTNIDITTIPNSVQLATSSGNPPGVDLAFGKTGVASGTELGSAITNITDGNDSTSWRSTQSDNNWVYIDLTTTRSLTSIRCKYGQEADLASSLVLQISTNGSSWTTIENLIVNFSDHIITHNFSSPTSVRYIRVYQTSASSATILHVATINAYEGFLDGTVITQIYNYGIVPLSYGNITANITVPTGTTIDFQIATGSITATLGAVPFSNIITNVAGNTSVNVNIMGTLTTLTLNTLAVIKIVPHTNTIGNETPIVTNFAIGAQWESQWKDLTAAPVAWGVFDADETLLTQSIIYAMDVSSDNGATHDGFITLTRGNVPVNNLKQYVRFRLIFNTTNYTQLPSITSINLNYFKTLSSLHQPCSYSFKDRLYFSFMSNGGTNNDHTWIGETKPSALLAFKQSGYTGIKYPLWSKCDFVGAAQFDKYKGSLIYGDDTNGLIFYMLSGLTKNGTAFTASFTTRAIGNADRQSIWRFLYIYGSADLPYNLYYRTKSGINPYSAWSSAIVIPATTLITKSAKITLIGLVIGDFIQFKCETTNTDANFAVQQIDIYGAAKGLR